MKKHNELAEVVHNLSGVVIFLYAIYGIGSLFARYVAEGRYWTVAVFAVAIVTWVCTHPDIDLRNGGGAGGETSKPTRYGWDQ